MKPSFTLNLSHEGIILLHKSPRGTWTEVGDVALDNTKLRESLSFLRSTAVGLEGKGFGTRLVIPNSQILYRDIYAPGPSKADRKAQIETALEGQTPYAVADLIYDWRGESQTIEVAIVTKETLSEAEEFAINHRFNPISFVGSSGDKAGAWEPFFGRTDYSFSILGPDVDVRDTPLPAPVPQNAESLLFDPTQSETPSTGLVPDAVDAVETKSEPESFFAPETPDPAKDNIIVEGAAEQVQAEPDVEPEPQPEAIETAPIPSFSSSRQVGVQSNEVDEHREISRVKTRFSLAPESGFDDAPSELDPAEDAAPLAKQLVAEDRLRSQILGDEKTAEARTGLAAKVKILAAFIGFYLRHFGRKTAALWKPVLLFIVVGLAPIRTSLKSRTTKTSEPREVPEITEAVEAVETAETVSDESTLRQKLKIAAAAVVAFIGLVGLLYAFVLPGSDDADRSEITLSATSAERGVHANNRARPRPSDFLELTSIPVLRPERRSLFEGSNDPDLGKPDTAEDAADLTEDEITKIRAAGLPVPEAQTSSGVTQEEIAEQDTSAEDAAAAQQALNEAYAATGILQGLIQPPTPSAGQSRDDIFVASVDSELEANDAIILPDFNNGPQDDLPGRKLSPLGPEVTFDLDANGLVKATRKGALNPDGIPVRLGKPSVTPPTKPDVSALVPPNPVLALKPNPRPADLKTGDDAIFVQGRMTLAKLRAFRSKPRPMSEQVELSGDVSTPTELAILTSFQPARRPSDFEQTVEKTRDQLASTVAATSPIIERGPVLPTRASVAKQATIKNAINLGTINLIGVSGSVSNRRALLRMPSGRFVRVKVGDRIDGGKIAAIDVRSLRYVKSGRNRVLKIPK